MSGRWILKYGISRPISSEVYDALRLSQYDSEEQSVLLPVGRGDAPGVILSGQREFACAVSGIRG